MSAHSVSITIDHQKREIAPGLRLGSELLQLAGIIGSDQLLLEVQGDIDIPVAPGDGIFITGHEAFSIGNGVHPIEDNPLLRIPIMFYFNGTKIPHDQALHHAKATGAELKSLDPNLKPGDQLWGDLEGFADEPISDNLRMIVQPKDRFIVVPAGNVGSGPLLDQHVNEIQGFYPGAYITEEDGTRYLVIPEVSLPEHWSSHQVTLLAILPNGYPMAALDMFWVDPSLKLANGQEPQGATVIQRFLGRPWQRFSWHYTQGEGAWRLGQSSLLTHLRFCQTRLAMAV